MRSDFTSELRSRLQLMKQLHADDCTAGCLNEPHCCPMKLRVNPILTAARAALQCARGLKGIGFRFCTAVWASLWLQDAGDALTLHSQVPHPFNLPGSLTLISSSSRHAFDLLGLADALTKGLRVAALRVSGAHEDYICLSCTPNTYI